MLASSLSALVTFAVSVPAYVLALRRGYTGTYRLMCLAVIGLGLAKLWRYRPIADVHIEPWMKQITGVHNLPIAMAATCAIVAYTSVLLAAVTKRTARRNIGFAVIPAIGAFWLCFTTSYGGAQSGRPASDGIDSAGQALSWALPLLIVSVVSAAVVTISVREIHLGPARSGLGVPHGLLLAGLGGLGYSLNKVVHVALSTIEAPGILIDAATLVGLIALPMSVVVLAITVYSPPVSELVNRLWRARRLIHIDQTLTHSAAWSIAADPQRAHEHVVDVSDDQIMGARRDTAS